MAQSDAQKLSTLGGKPYKEQAIWFLNAYWKTFAQQEGEKVWAYVHKHAELDPKGASGNELDEVQILKNQFFFLPPSKPRKCLTLTESFFANQVPSASFP